jgi:hypothetical protein
MNIQLQKRASVKLFGRLFGLGPGRRRFLKEPEAGN